jgi:NTP pyrophosphatase (non-canonical NTP hydrolase)
MAKFKVGDKVIPNEECHVDSDFTKSMFYVVQPYSADGMIYLIDDDGDERWRREYEFDLFTEDMLTEPGGSVQHFIPLIEQWGRDRGILDNSTPLGQSRKTDEEVRELIEAAAKMQAFMELVDGDIDHRFDSYETELADAIGDIFVTLVMVAGCAKLDINACVAGAYEEIKNRKGYLRPDGVFVKEEQV